MKLKLQIPTAEISDQILALAGLCGVCPVCAKFRIQPEIWLSLYRICSFSLALYFLGFLYRPVAVVTPDSLILFQARETGFFIQLLAAPYTVYWVYPQVKNCKIGRLTQCMPFFQVGIENSLKYMPTFVLFPVNVFRYLFFHILSRA